MNFRRPILAMLLLASSLFIMGCADNFLSKYEGEKIGIEVNVLDETSIVSGSDSYINDHLVKYIMKNKKMDVMAIHPEIIEKYGPSAKQENRWRLMQELGLDYLLVIDLDDIQFDFGSKIVEKGAFSFDIELIEEFHVSLICYLYDNKTSGPVFTGSSKGFHSCSIDSGRDLGYRYMLAVVNALKKTGINKRPHV